MRATSRKDEGAVYSRDTTPTMENGTQMAKKKQHKSSVYLTDQSPSELKVLVTFLEDRVSEMEMDEEFMEENGENLLPSLRGLVSFIREEHFEDDDSQAELPSYDDDYEEEEEPDAELKFD